MKLFTNGCNWLRGLDTKTVYDGAVRAGKQVSASMEYALEKSRSFNILDFAVFKFGLVSLGLWLGATFSGFFKKFRGVLFLGFIVSYIFLIWRIFFREDGNS